MNIKLNNENNLASDIDDLPLSSTEERRRTGRYVAIIVGISLVCLALYHAWVRRVAVLASLLVPALIMLLYIAWVLKTAAKDKKKAENIELGLADRMGDASSTIPPSNAVSTSKVSAPGRQQSLENPRPHPEPSIPPPSKVTQQNRSDKSKKTRSHRKRTTTHRVRIVEEPQIFKRSYSIA